MEQVIQALETLKDEQTHTVFTIVPSREKQLMSKKFALVVGASGEIGNTICYSLAEAGWSYTYTIRAIKSV